MEGFIKMRAASFKNAVGSPTLMHFSVFSHICVCGT